MVVRRAVPLTGVCRGLSAAGLAGVAAAALPLAELNPVVAEHEVQLPMEGHGGGHIGEKRSQGHAVTAFRSSYPDYSTKPRRKKLETGVSG
jgi:hypothetical protein